MATKKVVHTDDVTSVASWDLPEFGDQKSAKGEQPKILKTINDEELALLKKKANFGKSVVHTNDVSRVGVWDQNELQGYSSSGAIDPKGESTKIYTTEEFIALEQKSGSFSKVTATEDLSRIAIWDLPVFENTPDNGMVEVTPGAIKMPTAEEIEAVQDSAREEAYSAGFEQGKGEGFEQGKPEGYQAGLVEGQEQGREQAYAETKAELDAQIQQLKALCSSLAEPLKTLDNDVEQELVAVAIAVAKQVVRRELRTDPGQVVSAVRQAVSILPINARNIRVYLHPEDATLVKESLSVADETEEEQRWKIVEDPALTRGGCNVESDLSRIDATVDSRLAAVIAQVLGGERNSDND